MSALVYHMRPKIDTGTIKSGVPVSSYDWSGLGGLANFCNGHGGMLIPWTAVGRTITIGNTEVFHFYVAPKTQAVQRIWVVTMRTVAAIGVTADVVAGGASTVAGVPLFNSREWRRNALVFFEDLSAKTNTVGDTTLSVTANAGSVIVESVCMYEQTRGILDQDATDYGVDITSLRPRQPIADFANESIGGVTDGYKNMDARRAGFFHWPTPTSVSIQATTTAPADCFPTAIPMHPAIPTTTDTTASVTVAVFATSSDGSGKVDFVPSDSGAGTTTVDVTTTAASGYAWHTGSLSLNTEDLTTADGRRGASWEGVQIRAYVTNAAHTVNIAGFSIIRSTTPL